ncbi:hypothetical protein [Rhodoplanes sp. SY1]|uniref:hypothetical protein n=1 Tax=Rhodoplanes sp. SY1 TaxID=3166646 RepID=UPI0038B6508D
MILTTKSICCSAIVFLSFGITAEAENVYESNGRSLDPEVILSTVGHRCNPPPRPDAAVRFFRGLNDKPFVIIGDKVNRIASVQRFSSFDVGNCGTNLRGGRNSDFRANDYALWITGTWTEDGRNIIGLVHNEYWGHKHFRECNNNYTSCWWNSVVWARSIDGGRTFVLPPPEERLVIGFADEYKPMVGRPVGFMSPTNMVRDGDYVVAMVHGMGYGKQKSGNYLIRHSLSRPWNEWEVWNDGAFLSVSNLISSGGPVGQPLNVGSLSGFFDKTPMKAQTIIRIRLNGNWAVLLSAKDPGPGKADMDGFYIATSRDLIHWSEPRQLLRANLRPSVDCRKSPDSGPVSYLRYGTIVDPSSSDVNYIDTGNLAFLYTTRITGASCKDSNKTLELVRFQVDLGVVQ